MSDLYTAFLDSHAGQTPKTEQEWRAFLATKQSFLDRQKLTVDKMFESPRNAQPLEWIYARPPQFFGEIRCFAYERTAVDGKRFILGAGGRFAEIEDAEFKRAFPKAL